MMAFITHFSKKRPLNLWAWLLTAALLCLPLGLTHATEAVPSAKETGNTPSLVLEVSDGSLLLSAHFGFTLPAVVEDALYKGIPIYFMAQADLLRERWYWTKKTVASVQRRLRLAYHPLTRRWRLTMGDGDMTEATQGLTLSQSFDTLDEAMAAVRRTSRWKIAEVRDIVPGNKHVVTFSFELDTSQLPRPLQIGTLGQSDWVIDVRLSQAFDPESIK
ncbi:DUF4390 domain-containing protein [Rhodoferax sp.]|uniref:DUF4390 domain-containing protein n=1 Tax=Rhodoferax sp. TaxID=50421 RepID=UPI002844040D|nr:DUF4390 domain-containing protein [Rhodoferax sp.]MDR3367840.1 DUF4390 domain-containing protein [Rhodoferax sp.]